MSQMKMELHHYTLVYLNFNFDCLSIDYSFNLAAYKNQIDVMEILLKNGAEINKPDLFDFTALAYGKY